MRKYIISLTDNTNIQTNRIKHEFWIQHTSKRMKIAKTQLRKSDPKTILSLRFLTESKKVTTCIPALHLKTEHN